MEKITADGMTFTVLFPDLLRPLTDEEFEALEDSIRKFGVQTPIMVDGPELGIIDGIHRVRAYARLEAEGVELPELPVRTPEQYLKPAQIAELALVLNLERRQLTTEEVRTYRSNAEKRAAVEAALKASPEKSDSAIAKEVGVHHTTVATVRRSLANLASQPERVGSDGRTINVANIGKKKSDEVPPQDEELPTKQAEFRPVPFVDWLDGDHSEATDSRPDSEPVWAEITDEDEEEEEDDPDGMKAHNAELARLEAEHERKRNLGLLPDPFAGFPSDDDEDAEQEEDWDKTGAEVRRMQEDAAEQARRAEQARQAQANRERQAQERERSRREDLERRAAQVTEIPTDIWDVRLGDCVMGLAGLDRAARLVFADPPYNIGWDYGDGIRSDLLSGHAFLTWCRDWLTQIPDVLTDDGSFWLLISDEYAAEIKIAVEDAGLYLRQWLIWYEAFGVNCQSKFNRTHRHLLHFVRDESDFVFHENASEIRRPSDRQVKYGDARAAEGGKLWDSVWGINPPIPRVCGTHLEAIPGSPAPQLPLALLNPIIACASDPGDLIVDPFCGNATTGVAAINQGRRFIGFEKREPIHSLALLRMKAAWASTGRKES